MCYFDLGYNFGIIIYYLCKYINDNYKDNTLVCNSRNSYIIYRVLKDIFKHKNIKYIYTSRKVLFNTALDTNSEINSQNNRFIYESIAYGRYRNVFELLDYLDLSEYLECKSLYTSKEVLDMMQSVGFNSIYNNIEPFQKNHEIIQGSVEKLIILLQDIIYKKQDECIYKAKRYLKNKIKDGDIFIDIGWNCTTQYYLENLLNIELNGVYFETFTDVIELPKELKTNKFMKGFNNTCRGLQGLLEGCYFNAPHGSVNYYTDKGGFVLEEISEESKSIIRDIINGIMYYCKDYHKDKNDDYINQEFLEDYCKRILFHPTLEEANLINTIKHDNCGYSYSIINYRGKYNEIDRKRSFWKVGYDLLTSKIL